MSDLIEDLWALEAKNSKTPWRKIWGLFAVCSIIVLVTDIICAFCA